MKSTATNSEKYSAANDNGIQLKESDHVLKTSAEDTSHAFLHPQKLNNLFIHGREVVLYVANDERMTVEAISDSISTYGYIADDFSSGERSLLEIIYTDDIGKVTGYINEQLGKGVETFGLDYRIACKAGDPVWITCAVMPEYNQAGNATHFLMKIKDISGRVQYVEKLQDANENLRVTLKSIGEAVILIDTCGCIDRLNGAAEKLVGIISLKAQHKHLNDVIRFSFSEDFAAPVDPLKMEGTGRRVSQFDEIFMRSIVYDRLFRVSCNVSPIYVGRNRKSLVGYVLVVKDLTNIYDLWQAARETKTRLQENETTMHRFFDYSVDGIVLVDSDGIVMEWNHGYEQITGITKETAIGKTLWEVVLLTLPPEQQTDKIYAAMQSELKSVIAGMQQKTITNHVVHRQTGEHRILNVLYFPMSIPGKTMMGAISRDITDKVKAEAEFAVYHENLETLVRERTEELEVINEELHATNEELFDVNSELMITNKQLDKKNKKLEQEIAIRKKIAQKLKDSEHNIQNFIEQSFEGIMILDHEGYIIEWNLSLERITGVSRKKAIGMYEWDLLRDYLPEESRTPEAFDKLRQSRQDYIKVGRKQLPVVQDLLLLMPDGSKRYTQVSMFPIGLAEACYFGRVLHDVTEQKLADMELEQYRTQLEQMVESKTRELVAGKEKAEESDKLKSAFLANMSHEIRTPLNGIIGFLGLLTDDSLSLQRRQECINVINNSSKQLVKLIDDIIDIAKIEAKQLSIRPIPFRINGLMYELQVFFETYLKANNKDRVAMILDDSEFIVPCVTFVDPIRLRQILSNLIGNAIKFTDKGYIRFGYRQQTPGLLEFVVEDTGIGLAPDQLEVIFERFRQVESGNNRNYGGTGLGLAISRSLVQVMGGEMTVKSTQGMGSSFYFTISYIPVASDDEPLFDGLPGKESSSREVFKNKVVLLVESEILKYKFYEKLLSAAGFSVIRASGLNQWLNHINQPQSIDIVIANASECRNVDRKTIDQIRPSRTNLPTILLLPEQFPGYQQIIYNSQCDMVIEAPVHYDGLIGSLAKFIE